MKDFSQNFSNLTEILCFIHETSLGQSVLEQLKLFHQKHPVQIKPYPPSLTRETEPVLGALFVTDGQVGTIYIQPSQPLGLIIPFLFHEIIHCLDETLWRAARMKLPPTQKRNVLFNAECKAYHAQNLFLCELKVLYPELPDFYQNHYPHLSCLHRALAPYEVADLYGKAYRELVVPEPREAGDAACTDEASFR